MTPSRKPVIKLRGEITSPPFSVEARREACFLLGLLQEGEKLGMPPSRPMPIIGKGCHELRVRDENKNWRIIYHVATESIVILAVVEKKSATLPKRVSQPTRRDSARTSRCEVRTTVQNLHR